MSRITRGVMIDVGGVLARECLPGVAAAWGRRLGIPATAFMAALYEGNDSGVLIGRVSEDAWWGTVRGRLGTGPDVIAELRRDLAARESWDEELVACLRGPRKRGVPTAVVSNTWPGLRARMSAAGLAASPTTSSCPARRDVPNRTGGSTRSQLGRLPWSPRGHCSSTTPRAMSRWRVRWGWQVTCTPIQPKPSRA